ncbi:pyridine nucleotide-disulfide oxidoreductase [Aerococcus agrisoli]|uniref:Pyridine nucleotide-disulfide oxidoreductase n=1 Tax=Aerococcus agrisoli TaxID=2487350 RepID=A0A3N4GG73_9LACT|nr:FAD-dependent oxidoreductase [Aerococcus agrisoli]RPA57590.1 pyridine nucleotide-disulfide oxidoreductase [Aerococcus agrisoli]
MEQFDNIIIGFGKAGKTIAGFFAKQGQTVALIEASPKMYGGTCINVACLPSKNLITAAERKPKDADNSAYYTEAVQNKKALIAKLNNANYHNVADLDKGQVIDGTAYFLDDHTVEIKADNGETVQISGDRIIINTGARPNIPSDIDGLAGLVAAGAPYYTSESLMDQENYPASLTIIGDGFIGLEFASMYQQFGADVTVLAHSDRSSFLKKEDRDVAKVVLEAMEAQGIHFIFNASTTAATVDGANAILTYQVEDGQSDTITSEAVLVSVGRHANTASLKLENAGVEVNERGEIKVNKHLQTSKDHIFAVGDVKGGPQFTYVSLDDNRILKNFIFGDGSYNLETRSHIPTANFIEPSFASVGLTETAAKEAGYDVKVASLAVACIPKAKVIGRTTGIFKAVVDANTKEILGVRLFGEGAHEIINIVTVAMNAHLPYTALRDQIYTHPTLAEALNDLFAGIDA